MEGSGKMSALFLHACERINAPPTLKTQQSETLLNGLEAGKIHLVLGTACYVRSLRAQDKALQPK
jgi:hypothetical protein